MKAKFVTEFGCHFIVIKEYGIEVAKYQFFNEKWELLYCHNMKKFFKYECKKNEVLMNLGENKTQEKQPDIDWEASYNALKIMVERTLEPILNEADEKVPTDAFELLACIQGRRLCKCGRIPYERDKTPIDKSDVKE